MIVISSVGSLHSETINNSLCNCLWFGVCVSINASVKLLSVYLFQQQTCCWPGTRCVWVWSKASLEKSSFTQVGGEQSIQCFY